MVEKALDMLVKAEGDLAKAREAYSTAFLRAKISHVKPTDRQAEHSAEIEAGKQVLAAETSYFIARETFAAALRQGGN